MRYAFLCDDNAEATIFTEYAVEGDEALCLDKLGSPFEENSTLQQLQVTFYHVQKLNKVDEVLFSTFSSPWNHLHSSGVRYECAFTRQQLSRVRDG